MTRDLVFVSHSNPEDDQFSLWLALQLASEGYKVWCDLTQLIGGEKWWDEIEDAIRKDTVKFLYVLSRSSNHKSGPRRELHMAQNVERQDSLKHFVIPLHIDDLPHQEMNIQISDTNAIEFNTGWCSGFHRLLDRLV